MALNPSDVDLGGMTLRVNNIYTGATQPGAAGSLLNVSGGDITLPAGTATTAPLTFTSGTNLTSVTAGAVEFDGNAFYATSIAGSRTLMDTEQYIIQATEPAADSGAGLDSNAAAAFFTAGSGQITLTAGKTYYFEGMYLLTNTGTTSHTWGHQFGGTATFTALGTGYSGWGFSGTASGTGGTGGGAGMVTGFTATGSTTKITALTQASTSATENAVIQVCGTLVVANAGTLIPQLIASARPGASGTPGVTHKSGSYFKIWQMPTLGTVGNWS
jgi:hypothetical protein